MADADPEDEVSDVPRPPDGDVEAPDADPLPEEPGDADRQPAQRGQGDEEGRPPPEGRPALDDALTARFTAAFDVV